MVYEVVSLKKKSFPWLWFLILLVFVGLGIFFKKEATQSVLVEEVKEDPVFIPLRSWVDTIPSDLPTEQIVLLSQFINQSDRFNLDIGYGPLGVKPVDFDLIAPQYFEHPDIENEEQNLFVAYYGLRNIYHWVGDWPSTFVFYVYGNYGLSSEREVDVQKRLELLEYLGY